MWEEIIFPDTLVKNSVGRKNQINASEILSSGQYPVIDQGQDFIAGYCNDETKLVNDELPLIIFGDHTRCFKYVDFPFIIGADGTKALRPNTELFDAKYYYFALLSLNIPSRGYNRHFTLLKEKKVPKPDLSEQRLIAHLLSIVQTAIEQQARLIKLTRELKSTLMHKLFTEGLHSEKQKMTEIGPVPKSWEVVKLGDYADFKNGINFSAGDKGTGILTIDVLNMYGEGSSVSLENLYRVNKKIDESYLLEENDLLFVRSSLKREGVGWTSLFVPINEPVTFCGFIIRARLKDKITFSSRYMTNYCRTDIARKFLVSGSGQLAITNINQGILRDLSVPRPTREEQEEIASTIDAMDKKISLLLYRQEKLEELFRTLLHQLITGQTRVNDIDLL
jgi:type I restriction enzyme, S subunit